MERMYPSIDSVNVQRRVTIFGVKTKKSPDDPVHVGVCRSDAIGDVSQEVCPPSWHRLHSSDDPTLVVERVSQEGVSL